MSTDPLVSRTEAEVAFDRPLLIDDEATGGEVTLGLVGSPPEHARRRQWRRSEGACRYTSGLWPPSALVMSSIATWC